MPIFPLFLKILLLKGLTLTFEESALYFHLRGLLRELGKFLRILQLVFDLLQVDLPRLTRVPHLGLELVDGAANVFEQVHDVEIRCSRCQQGAVCCR